MAVAPTRSGVRHEVYHPPREATSTTGQPTQRRDALALGSTRVPTRTARRPVREDLSRALDKPFHIRVLESAQARLAAPHYARAADEPRSLIREALTVAGDFHVSGGQVHVTLNAREADSSTSLSVQNCRGGSSHVQQAPDLNTTNLDTVVTHPRSAGVNDILAGGLASASVENDLALPRHLVSYSVAPHAKGDDSLASKQKVINVLFSEWSKLSQSGRSDHAHSAPGLHEIEVPLSPPSSLFGRAPESQLRSPQLVFPWSAFVVASLSIAVFSASLALLMAMGSNTVILLFILAASGFLAASSFGFLFLVRQKVKGNVAQGYWRAQLKGVAKTAGSAN